MSFADPTAAARTALITGANTGIGRVTACELARQGYRVHIATRSRERTQEVLREIAAAGGSAQWLPLDLGDFSSVRSCVTQFLSRGEPLHLLVNNAGQAGLRGITASGFEMAFGINHMGHFLLTQLLLERMRDSGGGRIVTVSSRAHKRVPGIDWEAVRQPTKSGTGIPEYGVSKLANLLFSAELGRRLAGTGITTYSLHPGVVATDIWRQLPKPIEWLVGLFMLSEEQGAATTLHCATSPDVARETGLYYDKCKPIAPSAAGSDEALARELWARSEGWIR